MWKSWQLAGVLAISLATGAFANDAMELTGVNGGYVMGGVYTSPYSVSVNGTPMLLICDDFLTNVYLGQQWNAVETPLDSLPSLQAANGGNATSVVKFDHAASAATQLTDYETVAYLSYELINSPTAKANNFANETAGELSYAIWGVFDPQLLNTSYQNSLGANAEGKLNQCAPLAGGGCDNQLAAAQNFLAQARTAVASESLSSISNVTIYTPSPNQGVSQEYIYADPPVPEPSMTMLLGVNLAAALIALLAFRRFAVQRS